MIFRVKYKTIGEHVHFRIWVGRTPEMLALTNSDYNAPNIMRLDEFASFRTMLNDGSGPESDNIVLFSESAC